MTGRSHDTASDAASVSDRTWERLADHFSEVLVERWHSGDFTVRQPSLAEWMGLTDEQYAAWVEGRFADVLA